MMTKGILFLVLLSLYSCGDKNESATEPDINTQQPKDSGTHWNIEKDKWITPNSKSKKIELLVRASSDGFIEIGVINRDKAPIYVPPITPYNYWIGGLDRQGKEIGSIPRGTPPFVLEADLIRVEKGKLLSALLRPDETFLKSAVKVFVQPSYFIEDGATKTSIKGTRSELIDTSTIWKSYK